MSIGLRWLRVALMFCASATCAWPQSGIPTAPFTQCPAIAASPSCGVLIIMDAQGNLFSINDPAVMPYDSTDGTLGDDTLVGFLNLSPNPVYKITLRGTIPIFGFDGDGICTFPGGPACGATGYEGPTTRLRISASIKPPVTWSLHPLSRRTGPRTSAWNWPRRFSAVAAIFQPLPGVKRWAVPEFPRTRAAAGASRSIQLREITSSL